ncbi:hypothetical protein FBU30_008907 [Linnemannia zychae]|nr:hypothetical protein FBU30_008907 [Linnemannia zychae]
MAATSEQMVTVACSQDLDRTTSTHSLTSTPSHTTISGSLAPESTHFKHRKTNSLNGTSVRSSSERRPSFSITLPSSCSKSSHLTNNSTVFNTLAGPEDDNDSTAGFEEALALQQEANGTSGDNSSGFGALDPPARRRGVKFASGEDDNLTSHEGKQGLPKTPYPISDDQDKKIQHSLFKRF